VEPEVLRFAVALEDGDAKEIRQTLRYSLACGMFPTGAIMRTQVNGYRTGHLASGLRMPHAS